ncbi:hypothetical protein BsWGS_10546 [Bradybaena similaris]
MASASNSNQQALKNVTQITVDAVVEALVSLGEAKGSTLTNLKKYFVNKLPSHIRPNDIGSRIKRVLKKGEKEGKINRRKNRRYLPVINGINRKPRKAQPVQDDPLIALLKRRIPGRQTRPKKARRRRSRRRRRRRRKRCRRRASMRRRRKRKKCRRRRRGRSRRRRKALGS